MNYKLKTFPQVQWWTESRDFVIEDDSNSEIFVRVIESPDGTSVKVYNEDNKEWSDGSPELMYWVEKELEVHEMQLDFETRERSLLEKENQSKEND